MAQKFILSFDPGAGGDAFNSIVSNHRGYYKSNYFPAKNNNIVYQNPIDDLGMLIKQIPMVFDKGNIFNIPDHTSVFDITQEMRQYVNYVIDENFKRKLCLGTHWYHPILDKLPLDNTVGIKCMSNGKFVPLFFVLLFLKNFDYPGHDVRVKEGLVKNTLRSDQVDQFLQLKTFKGWERYVFLWDLKIKSFEPIDAFRPLYQEYAKQFTIKEFSDSWNYIDIGDFWFEERKDKDLLENIYDIKFDISVIDAWKEKNLSMVKEKFNLELTDFNNDDWIEPVIEYFTKKYNEYASI